MAKKKKKKIDYSNFLFPLLLVIVVLALLLLPKIDELLEDNGKTNKIDLVTDYYEDSIFDVLTCTNKTNNVTTTHYLYHLNKNLKKYITTTEGKNKSIFDNCENLKQLNKDTKGYKVRCYDKDNTSKEEIKVLFDEFDSAINYQTKFMRNAEITQLEKTLSSEGYTCTNKKG